MVYAQEVIINAIVNEIIFRKVISSNNGDKFVKYRDQLVKLRLEHNKIKNFNFLVKDRDFVIQKFKTRRNLETFVNIFDSIKESNHLSISDLAIIHNLSYVQTHKLVDEMYDNGIIEKESLGNGKKTMLKISEQIGLNTNKEHTKWLEKTSELSGKIEKVEKKLLDIIKKSL